MKRGLIIGMPTAGSTGQPLFIDLPGGGSARICTKRNILIDGSEFIGKGIQPDRLVSESVADIRAGVDSALEVALAEIRKSLKPFTIITDSKIKLMKSGAHPCGKNRYPDLLSPPNAHH